MTSPDALYSKPSTINHGGGVFSDEDLAKLKDKIAEPWPDNMVKRLAILASDLEALIARLEAAEALLFTPIDNFDQREKLKEAWKKAAGK